MEHVKEERNLAAGTNQVKDIHGQLISPIAAYKEKVKRPKNSDKIPQHGAIETLFAYYKCCRIDRTEN